MKILLVQNAFLGDVILSTPVIAGIHKLYPEAELWMMTTPAARELVERDPLLAGVITFDKRGAERGFLGAWRKARALTEMKFDKVYSLHRSPRTSLLLWLAAIPERVGFSAARLSFLYTQQVRRARDCHDVLRNLSILVPEASLESFEGNMRLYAEEAQRVLRGEKYRLDLPAYIALVPGSAWRTKRWSIKGYRDVAQHFARLGKRVVLLGTANESEICAKVAHGIDLENLCGRTSVSEFLSVISGAELVICNDSMALQAASGLKVPNVAIFCATSPEFGFGPWRNRAVVVERNDLACKPCGRHGAKLCPAGTYACMEELPASRVIDAAERLMDQKQMVA